MDTSWEAWGDAGSQKQKNQRGHPQTWGYKNNTKCWSSFRLLSPYTERSGQTEPEDHNRQGKGMKKEQGKVAEAQIQLDGPISANQCNFMKLFCSEETLFFIKIQHNIVDKSYKTYQCHCSTWLFPVGVDSFYYYYYYWMDWLCWAQFYFLHSWSLNKLPWGVNFGSSCNVYYQCRQVFTPLAAIYHALFIRCHFSLFALRRAGNPFFCPGTAEIVAVSALNSRDHSSPPSSIPCQPTERHRWSFNSLPSRDELIYIQVFQISKHHWSPSYFCLYFWVSLEQKGSSSLVGNH